MQKERNEVATAKTETRACQVLVCTPLAALPVDTEQFKIGQTWYARVPFSEMPCPYVLVQAVLRNWTHTPDKAGPKLNGRV